MNIKTIITLINMKEYSEKIFLITKIPNVIYRHSYDEWRAFHLTKGEISWFVNHKEIKVTGDDLSNFYRCSNFCDWLNNQKDIPSLDRKINRIKKIQVFL